MRGAPPATRACPSSQAGRQAAWACRNACPRDRTPDGTIVNMRELEMCSFTVLQSIRPSHRCYKLIARHQAVWDRHNYFTTVRQAHRQLLSTGVAVGNGQLKLFELCDVFGSQRRRHGLRGRGRQR